MPGGTVSDATGTDQLSPTNAKCKHEKTDQERSHALASLKHAGSGSTDHDDMSNTANKYTNHDGLVATQLNVGNVRSIDGDREREKEEEQHKGVSELFPLTKSSSSLLCAWWRSPGTIAA